MRFPRSCSSIPITEDRESVSSEKSASPLHLGYDDDNGARTTPLFSTAASTPAPPCAYGTQNGLEQAGGT